MDVRLMLVSESGEVIDSTDLMPAKEFNLARVTMPGAMALLGELQHVSEEG